MKKIKVILVDDHAVVRAGYKILLRNNENINIVAETSTGEDAIILSDKYQPDLDDQKYHKLIQLCFRSTTP